MTTHWIFCYPKHHIHKIHIKIGIFKSMFKTCMKKNEMYRGWFENHRPSFSPPNDEPLNRTVKSTCDNWWLYASCLHNYLISIVSHSLKNLKIFSRYLSYSSIALLDTSICFFQTFCFQDVFKESAFIIWPMLVTLLFVRHPRNHLCHCLALHRKTHY